MSQAVTGMLLSGADFNTFPGSLVTAGMTEGALEAMEEPLEELHEVGYVFILFFIAAHLFGLVAHEVREKTGLLSSMVNGKKFLRRKDVDL